MRPQVEPTAGPTSNAVVCVVHDPGTPQDSTEALDALARHTSADIPLVLLGLPTGQAAVCAPANLQRVTAVALASGTCLTDWLAQADATSGSADLVLMSSACRVPSGWLSRLRSAALSGDTVATATPLSSGDGTVGVQPGAGPTPDSVIAAVATHSYPRLQIGGPHCLYIRRHALGLLGGIPEGQMTLAALMAALCARFVAAGLLNVLADDLYLTGDRRGAGTGEQGSGDGEVAKLCELDRSDERSPLQRAVSLANAALGGLTVTMDGRSLGQAVGGTQRYTLELALALARYTDVRVRVVVAPGPGCEEDSFGLGPSIDVITYDQAVAGVDLTHVVHRPQQVFSADDLNLLRLLGRRLVITHQDLIGYHNPTYHDTFDTWEQYRRITRIALAAADRVVFFSDHSRGDAQAEDLVSEERCDVVGAALAPQPVVEPAAPAAALKGEDFILCLGADYRHKNRPFALRLVSALRREHNWRGRLVLAGAHVPHGSSAAIERELLDADPELRSAVIDLGSVNDAERAWLFRHARAIAVPSVVEGFGLVPLEAAEAALPCLFAARSSLSEVVSGSLASLVPWNSSQSAARVISLLGDGEPRRRHVAQLRRDAARWSWEQLAGQMVAVYEHALRMPYRAAAIRAWQELEREQYLVEVDRARTQAQSNHDELLRRLGHRIALASDDGLLTARQQQGLLRVGARPALARTMLWPFAVLGSVRSRGANATPDD